MRDAIHTVTDHPGLWRGWGGTFLGWLLIVVPGVFLVVNQLTESPRTGVRRAATDLRWGVLGLAFFACAAFALLNISWGIDTDWTFTK
jgi:hypothetical protein